MISSITQPIYRRARWSDHLLYQQAHCWLRSLRQRLGAAHQWHSAWQLLYAWPTHGLSWLATFTQGQHVFQPLRLVRTSGARWQVWSYLDRLCIHWLMGILRPTFMHVIPPTCVHLAGPSAIKPVTRQLQAALASERYHYVLRLDIRSYYASINHSLLLRLLRQHYADPQLLHYLSMIVTAAVDDGGCLRLPTQGIPRGSALSPFFGGLYLSELDNAFANRPGVFYRRYMDDIIILCANKRQYAKARKCVFSHLKQLRLRLSPHKSRMGRLGKGFHFLGVNVVVSQNAQSKNQTAGAKIHSRTCHRALAKVRVLVDDAVNPAKIQRYLSRWAIWWSRVTQLRVEALLQAWVKVAAAADPPLVWVGSGLLLDTGGAPPPSPPACNN